MLLIEDVGSILIGVARSKHAIRRLFSLASVGPVKPREEDLYTLTN